MPDPLRVASQTVTGFDRGQMTLDGKAVNLLDIMRMIYRIRASQELP